MRLIWYDNRTSMQYSMLKDGQLQYLRRPISASQFNTLQ